MQPIVIETSQLGFQTGNHAIVKGIDWNVRQGEHWVVFGMNGSGKTTLLSLIAGYQAPTSGSLHVFGQPYNEQSVLTLGRRIGWVSGSFFGRYYHQESVLEIVLSGKLATLGLDTTLDSRDVRQAKSLLKAFHLQKVACHPFQLLSNGERQGVLMARALMARPDILIMDEPTAGLDIFSREYLLQIIQGLARSSAMTLIFVTHYAEEIFPEFEHCLLLRDDQAFASGGTQEVFSTETLSEFIRYPVTVNWEANHPQVKLTVDTPVQQWFEAGLLPSL